MKKLSDLLEKFAKLGLKEREQKEEIIKILEQSLNVSVESKDVEIKDRKIRLKLSGPQKTEVILNKQKLLKDIGEDILDII